MERLAFTIDEFCKAHGIGRRLFYKLLQRNEAPATFKAGARTLISTEAAASWRRELEARSAAARSR
jgi:predicted DNA-binding transcriptional regulator AlpA